MRGLTLNKLLIETVHVFILRLTAGLLKRFLRRSEGFPLFHGRRSKQTVARALIFSLGIAQLL